MIARNARQPAESPLVGLSGIVPVISLHQADEVFIETCPQASAGAVFLHICFQRARLFSKKRHRQVAGQDVVKSGNVGRTLNRGMTPQRQYSATRPTNVSEE